MLIFYQVPIADFRSFIQVDTGKLPKPFWPTPSPNIEFVRNFGEVRRRGKGGIDGWIGENEFCVAKNAVKFSGLPFFNSGKTKINFSIGGRHFYADGDALAKLEIVYLANPLLSLETSQQLCEFVDHVLNFRALVSLLNKKSVPERLTTIGKNLSQLYLLASSDMEHLKNVKSTWVISGEPILVLEAGSREKVFAPKSTIIEVPNYPINIYHWWQQIDGNKTIGIWLVKRHSEARNTKNVSRLVRIALMRLHAEQQVLGLVLRAIATKTINFTDAQISNRMEDPQLQCFQGYLNHALHTILGLNRDVKRYFEPNHVGDLIRDSFEKVSPGNRYALLRQLEKFQMRPQVSKQVTNYINHTYIKEQIMGDKYENRGQVGAMGPNAHLENVQIIQSNISDSELDLKKLSKELAVLKKEMKKIATDPEHALAIGAVSAAEQSAKKNDSKKTIEFLKSAGSWALDVATKIGVDVAIAAIKSSMGLP